MIENQMQFNKALTIAQKGGYPVFWNAELWMYYDRENDRGYTMLEVFSDPRFWKAFSKAKGYGDTFAKELWTEFMIDYLYQEKKSEDFFKKNSHD